MTDTDDRLDQQTRPLASGGWNTAGRPAAAFVHRHVGPSEAETATMLEALGLTSLDELAERALPEGIRDESPLALPSAAPEEDVTAELRMLAAANRPGVPMIGLGFFRTVTPAVIRRNVLESPAWYTAYTPYQPEIAQGRLEALLLFQTMIEELTGLDVAGASLLDESSAAAEAMLLCRRVGSSPSRVLAVDEQLYPQTQAVLETRARPVGIELRPIDPERGLGGECFAVLVASPGADGRIRDLRPIVEAARAVGALVGVSADPLALALLEPPGSLGCDVAFGSTQRFGVPLGYGGPAAAYLAVRRGLERQLPGRLVGVSVDDTGRPAFRLALQAREQHIRRERATSNICTAQALLAVVAAMYAAYHGPDGLTAIAEHVHRSARALAAGLERGGVGVGAGPFFDTLVAQVPGRARQVVEAARRAEIELRLVDEDRVGVSCDETTRPEHLAAVWAAFGVPAPTAAELSAALAAPDPMDRFRREGPPLTHPNFRRYHSETALLRYLRRLSDADLALDRTMIPLGSCTMKLNAAVELEPITWPGFADVHPFVPEERAQGYLRLVDDLGRWLCEVTGYDACSLQPNAGSQGELAGLLAVRGYLEAEGEAERDVCLIPSSAHGTNAASATLAGLRVVVVACDARGNVDLADLAEKVEEHRDRLAVAMLTYPSTHGVYEDTLVEIAERVHAAGGQVYVDGANLNALVGLARLGRIGADVSHLNLHKTFCIPHGGGGPGVGPTVCRSHLAPYLPGHPLGGRPGRPVAAAPFGSAGVLPIAWAYIRLLGPDGLRRATLQAVLAANYVARRLEDHYPVLYRGRGGFVAHECILDLRELTRQSGVTAEDVAKRLIDYGFHAPTMSFPVAGTLMVEPTESEPFEEIERFCTAMIAIRGEIQRVIDGVWPLEASPLRQAPHTAAALVGEWDRPYGRREAVFPLPGMEQRAYWPPVGRIDSAFGDRHLACACPPVEAFGN